MRPKKIIEGLHSLERLKKVQSKVLAVTCIIVLGGGLLLFLLFLMMLVQAISLGTLITVAVYFYAPISLLCIIVFICIYINQLTIISDLRKETLTEEGIKVEPKAVLKIKHSPKDVLTSLKELLESLHFVCTITKNSLVADKHYAAINNVIALQPGAGVAYDKSRHTVTAKAVKSGKGTKLVIISEQISPFINRAMIAIIQEHFAVPKAPTPAKREKSADKVIEVVDTPDRRNKPPL